MSARLAAHARSARRLGSGALPVCLGLLVAVLATYVLSLRNAPVWDDGPLVVDNPLLGSVAGLVRLWSADLWTASARIEPSSYYRPFTMFTFWVNVAIGGRSAVSLRLGNVLIHAANAILLATFTRKAYGLSWRTAGLVSLVFALAPVCSEPVLWISGRFDLLVVMFALLAVLAARIDGNLGLALVLASVGGGLFSKESYIAWLPLLLLDDVFVLRRLRIGRLVSKYAAVAAIAVGYLFIRRLVGIPSIDVFRHTGLRALAESFLFLVATFVRELLWPSTLDPFRPYITPSLAVLGLTGAILVAAVGGTLVAFRRRPANPATRFAFFGLTWFVLATLPSTVVGPTLAMVGDRYAYLPLVGVFLAVAAVAGEIDLHHPRSRFLVSALATSIAVVCGIVTARHGRDWRNDGALAASSLASDPENPYALYWLGSEAAQHGRLAEADDLLARSLARNSESWRTWNAVCYLRLNQGRLPEAELACKHAIGLLDRNPRMWVNLSSVYVRQGRWAEARESADRALALRPAYAEAHYLAGVSSANLGLNQVAWGHIRAGLAAEPSNSKLLSLQADLARSEREHPAP